MSRVPDLTDDSFGDIFIKHPSKIHAHRCARLVMLEAFVTSPFCELFLALPEPSRFENAKSVPLKFAAQQRGDLLLAAENDQRSRTEYVNNQPIWNVWAAEATT